MTARAVPVIGARRRPERGVALVVVLWVTTLLAVIAASLAFATRTETRAAAQRIARAQAQALAQAGIERAALELLRPPAARAWRVDGTAYGLDLGDGTLEIAVRAVNGRIDLNHAPPEVLHGLFASLEVDADPAALADAVLDWRDTDDERRARGAEDPEYAAAGRPYGARDGPFLAAGEVTQVLGVSYPIYRQLRGLVTIHARADQIDPASAPRGVLEAIPGLDRRAIERFLAAREAGEPIESALPLLGGGARFLARSSPRAYVVRVRARSGRGALVRREAVIRITGRPERPYVVLERGVPGPAAGEA